MALAAALSLALASAVWAGSGLAAETAADTTLEKDIPNLLKAYPLAGQKADFIIAIDQSGSMKPFWPEVRDQLIRFIGAVPDGDFVSVIGFASQADDLLIPRRVDSSTRGGLATEVLGLAPPFGKSTDLAAAARKCLETVNRPAGSGFAFVFVFTDFIHAPAAGTLPKERLITSLREAHDAIIRRQGRFVRLYALQLPLAAGAGRDLDIFGAAFGEKLTRVTVTRETLAPWFDSVRATLQREKIKARLEGELRQPLSVEGIELRNGTAVAATTNRLSLPLTVRRLSLDLDGRALEITGSGPIAPGGSQSLRGSHHDRSWKTWLLPERTRQEPLSRLDAEFTLPFDAEIAKLGLPSTGTYPVKGVSARIITGTPPAILAAAVLAVLGLAYLYWRVWGRPERPFGGRRPVSVTAFLDGARIGMKSLDPGAGPGGCIQIRTTDFQSDEGEPLAAVILEIFGARPRFPRLRPKRGTYVRRASGSLSFSMQAAPTAVTGGKPGAILLPSEPAGMMVPAQGGFTLQCQYSVPGGIERTFALLVSC